MITASHSPSDSTAARSTGHPFQALACRLARESRLAQGLPEKVVDPAVINRLATLVHATAQQTGRPT